MMNWLILAVLLTAFQINAHAMNLDSLIDFTGNEVYSTADLGTIESGSSLSNFLGGQPASAMTEEAFQFTVSEPLYVNHLNVNASQIGVFGISNTPESMNVSFGFVSGTQPQGPGHFPAPGTTGLYSSSHTFNTIYGQTTEYNNLNVPMHTELQPGNTYWLVESDPKGGQGSVVDFSSTDFMGKVAVPETPTCLFFGLILFLVTLRLIHSRRIWA